MKCTIFTTLLGLLCLQATTLFGQTCIEKSINSAVESSCKAGGISWILTERMLGDPNGSYGGISQLANQETSKCLLLTDLGFSLPPNANIQGITVTITKQNRLDGELVDETVHLIKPNDGLSTDNKALATPWPSSMTAVTYGGDLWGETWTPAMINSADFGVSLEVTRTNNGSDDGRPVIDALQIEICYAETCPDNKVSGTVYYDYTANGKNEDNDFGIAGITVKAYDNDNVEMATGVTDSNGDYELNMSNGEKARIEFSNLPANYNVSPFGNNSKTTVAFVESPVCDIDLGLLDDIDYCEEEPLLITPCFVNGDPLAGGSAGSLDAMVTYDYSSSGTSTMPNHIVNADSVGSVWGVAYQKTSQMLFSSSFLKRHVGFGSLGIGGIYYTDLSAATPKTLPFVDLQTLGLNLGNVTSRDLSASATSSSRDTEAYDKVGKIGLGDLDISADGKTLWTVNLFTNELVSIFINDPLTVPTANEITNYALPTPTCNNGVFRAWGLDIHDGKILVGGTCTGELAGSTRSDLTAYVYEFDPNTGNFTELINFPLDYEKGWTHVGAQMCKYWETWTNDFEDLETTFFQTNHYRACRPQAILADIEVDGDFLILGFMDRNGHQTGRRNLSPITSDNQQYSGYISGDILRVYNNNGTYELENNATVGGVTGCGANTNEGPGGGEFYCGDYYSTFHNETHVGGLELRPGTNEVVANVMDPLDTWSGGTTWFSNLTGEDNKRYEIFNTVDDGNGDVTFGKANGLGDLELLCGIPTLEIGNRIWADANGDGIQDAGELPIQGVIVELFDQSGVKVGTVTTNANGHYFFNDSNVTGGLDYSATYFITLSNTQFGSEELNFGSTNYGGITQRDVSGNGVADVSDSDAYNDSSSGIMAIDTNNLPYIQVSTGYIGENNHNYDIGFTTASVTPTCEPPKCLPVDVSSSN